MNIENCRLALKLGGTDAPASDDAGMILAAASRGAVKGQVIADAIAALIVSGAIASLDPLVVDGGHPDWTPFFLELMASGDSFAPLEIRRRAEDTTRGGDVHWVEICSALHETPFESVGSNLNRQERPYLEMNRAVIDHVIIRAIRPFVPGEFAQPVAQVNNYSDSVSPDVSNDFGKTARKRAAKKATKKAAK